MGPNALDHAGLLLSTLSSPPSNTSNTTNLMTKPLSAASTSAAVGDDRLQTLVQQTLRESDHRPLQDLRLHCTAAGVVTIEGRLPSFYLKQLAQTIVMGIDDVTRVHNNTLVD